MRRQIRAKEIGVTDRNSVLRKDGKSFNFALEYYNQVAFFFLEFVEFLFLGGRGGGGENEAICLTIYTFAVVRLRYVRLAALFCTVSAARFDVRPLVLRQQSQIKVININSTKHERACICFFCRFFLLYTQVRRKEKDQAKESVDASYGKRKTRADREARQSASGR